VLSSLVLPLDQSSWQLMPIRLPALGHLLVTAFPILPNLRDEHRPRVLEYDADGRLLRQATLSFLHDLQPVAETRAALFGCLYPPAALPLYFAWHDGYGFDNVLGMSSHDHRRLFLGCLLASTLICAAATVLLSRRLGFGISRTLAWTIANIMLGPAGIVVLSSLHEWPARETCAACGATKCAGQRQCRRCDAPPPLPAFDGREIFEPA
jgi:hypothetical protein